VFVEVAERGLNQMLCTSTGRSAALDLADSLASSGPKNWPAVVLGGSTLLLHYHAGVTQAWLQQAQKRLAEIKLEVLANQPPASATAIDGYAVMAA